MPSDTAAPRVLLDYFTPVISEVLELDRRLTEVGRAVPGEAGIRGPVEVFEELRNRIEAIVEEAVAAGKQRADAELAKLAVVAWTDDLLVRHGSWMSQDQRLQRLVYAGKADYGSQFPAEVTRLTSDQSEVAEVFLTVLGLDFAGSYVVGDGPNRRQEARRFLKDKLRERLIGLRGDSPITPQPFQMDDPMTMSRSRSSWKLWLLLGAAAVAVLALVAVAVLLFNRNPGPPPGPPVADLREKAGKVAEGFSCANLTVEFSDGADGPVVKATGRVESLADVDRLRRDLGAVEGIGKVDTAVKVWPRPFCTALDLLQSSDLVATGVAEGPQIVLNKAGEQPQYRDGDNVYIRVEPPANRGHLYVAYFNIRGEMFQILPGAAGTETLRLGRETVTAGVEDGRTPVAGDRPINVKVTEPQAYGMLMAFYAPEPLWPAGDPIPDTAAAYVSKVEAGLRAQRAAGAGEGALLADYVILDLKP